MENIKFCISTPKDKGLCRIRFASVRANRYTEDSKQMKPLPFLFYAPSASVMWTHAYTSHKVYACLSIPAKQANKIGNWQLNIQTGRYNLSTSHSCGITLFKPRRHSDIHQTHTRVPLPDERFRKTGSHDWCVWQMRQ